MIPEYFKTLYKPSTNLIMNPKSLEARNRDDKPFDGLKISNSDALHSLGMRSPCPRCNKSRMYFCYTCFVPVNQLEGRIPLCRVR